ARLPERDAWRGGGGGVGVGQTNLQFSCRSHCPDVIELSCDFRAPIDSHWFSPRSSGAVTGPSAMNAKGAPKATAGAPANGRNKSNSPFLCLSSAPPRHASTWTGNFFDLAEKSFTPRV